MKYELVIEVDVVNGDVAERVAREAQQAILRAWRADEVELLGLGPHLSVRSSGYERELATPSADELLGYQVYLQNAWNGFGWSASPLTPELAGEWFAKIIATLVPPDGSRWSHRLDVHPIVLR